jgi:hypothetical protein
MGEPLKASAVSFEIPSSAAAIMPPRRNVDEMMTALLNAARFCRRPEAFV